MLDLKELEKYGILTEEDMCQQLKMKKMELMLRMHPHPITQLSNGRWQTYFDNTDTGKRVEIKLATKERVIEKLYVLYYGGGEEKAAPVPDKAVTISRLFDEWSKYKEHLTSSENTITRYRQTYMRYLHGHPITRKDIREISKIELNEFCNNLVKEEELSLKGWMNIKTILNGIYDFAIDHEILDKNPLERVKITVKYRQVNRRTDGSQCFNTKEVEELTEYMVGRYEETGNVGYLSPPFQLLTGLRVGELAALKWEDVDFDNHMLHVVREESRIREKKEYIVVNHTKGNRDRFVVLVPKAEEYLRMILKRDPGSEFIFVNDGERLTADHITRIYEGYAKKTHRPMKRSHKARKTYASVLHHNGVPIEKVREQLGHKDLVTTMDYIYNPLTDDETYRQIRAALA